MKYVLFMLAFSAFAGLDTVKNQYESKLKALRKEYITTLQHERQRQIRRGNDVQDINAEIVRISGLLSPMAALYRIKYTTGIRHYEFKGNSIYYREGRERSTYVRQGDVIIITHTTGDTETWERKGSKWSVVFTSNTRDIKGEADPIK